jgi:hypothetical protein
MSCIQLITNTSKNLSRGMTKRRKKQEVIEKLLEASPRMAWVKINLYFPGLVRTDKNSP